MSKVRYIVILFVLLGWEAPAQMFTKTFDVSRTITLGDSPNDVPAQHVIMTLASAFNLSANGFKIRPEGTLKFELMGSPKGNQYFLKSTFVRKKMSGDLIISGFRADSILWPQWVSCKIQIYNGRHLRKELDMLVPTDGTDHGMDVTEWVTTRTGELGIRMVEASYIFAEAQVADAEAWTAEVRGYYSFARMIARTNTRFKNYSTDNNRDKAMLLLDRFELERMRWCFNQQHFSDQLQLAENDPEKLLVSSEQLLRYLQRAQTLFDQTLDEPHTDIHGLADRFCQAYVGLSVDYLTSAKRMSPADAIAPMLMAEVPQAIWEMQNLQSVIGYVSDKSMDNQHDIPKKIADGFVAASEQFVQTEDFSNALLLLNNAAFVQSSFHLNPGKIFEEQYLMAFEGVAVSYLKVIRMAATMNKKQLTLAYLQRAMSMLQTNGLSLNNLPPRDSAMPNFFDEVIQLSYLPADQLASQDKFIFLENVRPLIWQFGPNRLPEFNQAYSACLKALFEEKLSDVQTSLVVQQYPDAAGTLLETGNFYSHYRDYLGDQAITLQKLSDELFQVYVVQSDQLLRGGQPGVALEQLMMARNLAKWLPDSAMRLVENKLDQVVIPLIEDEISKTRYEIWALHLEEAALRLQKIDSIEQRYLDGKYPDMLLLIREVRGELSERGCVVAQQKLDNSVNEIFTALRNRAYKAALNALEMAEKWSTAEPPCSLNLDNFNAAQQACRPLLVYMDEMKQVKSLLFEQGYAAAIDRYVKLHRYVTENQLDTIGIRLPALYTFVGEQRLPLLTITSAEYYADKGQYDESLQYVWLAKYQKIEKSELRSVMRKLASGLAVQDKEGAIPVDEAIERYTNNDQYFSYFKFVYKKNRLL